MRSCFDWQLLATSLAIQFHCIFIFSVDTPMSVTIIPSIKGVSFTRLFILSQKHIHQRSHQYSTSVIASSSKLTSSQVYKYYPGWYYDRASLSESCYWCSENHVTLRVSV